MSRALAAVGLLFFSFGSASVRAQAPHARRVEDAAEEDVAEEHHRNEVGLFLGDTSAVEEGRDGFTIGGEYVRRLNHLVGVGVEGEYVSGALDEAIFIAPVFFRLPASFRFALGPGLENRPVEEEENVGEVEELGEPARRGGDRETEFLFRFSLLRDFAVKKMTVTPSFSVDIVSGQAVLVSGVTFGFGF